MTLVMVYRQRLFVRRASVATSWLILEIRVVVDGKELEGNNTRSVNVSYNPKPGLLEHFRDS